MSKIAKKIADYLDAHVFLDFYSRADMENGIDTAISGHTIKKSELDLLRAKAEAAGAAFTALITSENELREVKEKLESRVHTVIPVSEHEKIKKLEENCGIWKDRAERAVDKIIALELRSEVLNTKIRTLEADIARRIDLDLARTRNNNCTWTWTGTYESIP